MTSKDYKLIAAALNASKPLLPSEEGNCWLSVVAHITMALRGDNPRFDVHKFREACHAERS